MPFDYMSDESRPVLHEILIRVFMTMTTPVTFMLLVRVALHRDRSEGQDPAGGENQAPWQ